MSASKLDQIVLPVEGQPEHQDAVRPKNSYPDGWVPGVQMSGNNGTVTSAGSVKRVRMDAGKWKALLEHFGVDPALYRVIEPVRMKSWNAMTGKSRGNEIVVMFHYQADFVSIADEPDLESLYREIRRARPHKARTRKGEPSTLVVNLCDWQAGKSDGDGTTGTLERISSLQGDLLDHVSDLRRAGLAIDELVVAGVGDLVEGCTGFYAMQEHSVQLDRRNQTKLVRRALRDDLKAWAPQVEQVRVTAVGGNHGENRKDGKAFTTFNDNDDVSVFEQVAEVLAENPAAYSHVKFTLPAGRLAVALEVQGRILAWTHGHIAKRGGEGITGMWAWWKDQSHGRYFEGVADADILICGHYHHLAMKEQEGRLLMLCPTIEGGSDWFGAMKGVKGAKGTLTFVMTPAGWSNLEVI